MAKGNPVLMCRRTAAFSSFSCAHTKLEKGNRLTPFVMAVQNEYPCRMIELLHSYQSVKGLTVLC